MGNNKRILVVDDSYTISEFVGIRLSEAGYTVFKAADGAEGFKKIKELKPDLVILDIKLPDMEGFEVCRLSKADPQTRHIPVVFLSASTQQHDLQMAESVGADGFVAKPYEGKGLLEEVKKFLKD
jgi:two-component system alkaline phosphatase synthesis response regulator PhoP